MWLFLLTACGLVVWTFHLYARLDDAEARLFRTANDRARADARADRAESWLDIAGRVASGDPHFAKPTVAEPLPMLHVRALRREVEERRAEEDATWGPSVPTENQPNWESVGFMRNPPPSEDY